MLGETWLIESCETLNHPYGSGACGACPAYQWGVTALREDAFVTVGSGFVTSAPYGGYIQQAETKDPAVIAFRTLQYDDENDREEWQPEGWRYSPTSKSFERLELDDLEGLELVWPEDTRPPEER